MPDGAAAPSAVECPDPLPLPDRRFLVCLGAGGVGKTTVAAATAVAAAARGRRVLCMTVDPARRLADSLGMAPGATGDTPIPADRLRAAGIEPAGTLACSQLDAGTAFERVIRGTAPDPATADRIVSNPLYRYFAESVAAIQEFTAMENMLAARSDPRYDLVVIDTPPTSNAIDFLDAPRRVVEALDSPIVAWLADGPGAGGVARLAARTARLAVRAMARMAGAGLMEQIGGLLADSRSLMAAFRARAEEVDRTLRSDEVGFLIVTTPEPPAVDEAIFLHDRLGAIGRTPEAFVVNRVRPGFGSCDAAGRGRRDGMALLSDPAARLRENLERQNRLAGADEAEIARLRRRCGPGPNYSRLPMLDWDVHDLPAVARVAELLFGAAGTPP